ncbi:MAG: serine/threonine protein kinase [Deltaproteobacteria bacterium]|nr:serine/threonine protein kinase [Deltaproteobacteria bacterium]
MLTVAKLAADTVVGGDFRIVAPIGTGGMGTVYEAEQLSTGRKRAVKVLHDQWADDDKQRERFVRESKVGAQVDSGHVVDVIAAGTEDDGTAWIAMELLEGEDLASFLAARGPVSPAELLEMFEQICHALAAAHAVKLVHRDIKPENIFITRPKEARARPLVKVLDFGIAKLVAQGRTGSTTAIGSPAWMSPEQADPKVAITPGTDVWALGLLAFWLLTGRSYWRAATEAELSIHALMKEILFDARPLASTRAEELDAADRLPVGFDDWFDHCVHREPRARFTDAGALLEALRELVDGDDVQGVQGAPAEPSQSSSAGAEVDSVPMSTRAFLQSSQIGPSDELSDAEALTATAPSPQADDGPDSEPAPAPEPLPKSRTSEPQAVDPTAAEPSKGRGWLLGGLGATLAAGLIWWLVPASEGTTAQPSTAGPAASAGEQVSTAASATVAASEEPQPTAAGAGGATAGASGEPSVETATPTGAALTKAAPLPTGSATASASASASGRPMQKFNKRVAEMAIKRRLTTVKRMCKGRTGPKSWAGTVTFAPTGQIQTVSLGDVRNKFSMAGRCVHWNMSHFSIGPYDGGPEVVPFLVTLE